MATSPDSKPAAGAPKPAGRELARTDLEAVIRRAVELAHAQGDLEDTLTEAELVRIGSELGLPAAQVRRGMGESEPRVRVHDRDAEHLAREVGERFEPPAILRTKVANGELGRKSGQGFYSWASPAETKLDKTKGDKS